MRLIVGHVWTTLDGVYPRNIIHPITSYPVDGAWFSKAYKRGYWDGRHSFVQYHKSWKVHYFPTGFLDRVTKALDEADYPYSLDDTRSVDYDYIEPQYQLHPDIDLRAGVYGYQAGALETCLRKGRGLVKIATGGGKTEVGAGLLASLPKPALWLTHRVPLLYQTVNRLAERLQTNIGIVGDGQYDVQDITVAMVQTAYRRQAAGYEEFDEFLKNVKTVIGDEIHHLESDQWYTNFCAISAPYRFGLTATPHLEGSGLSLLAMTGEVIVDIHAIELIERGVLVPPRIWFYRILGPKVTKALNYQQVYSQAIVNNQQRNEAIVDIAGTFKQDGKSALTLVTRINHGEMLADMLNFKGIQSEFIRGSMGQSDRDKVMDNLTSGRLNHVVAIASIMGEGMDFPHLRALINATGSRCGGNVKDGDSGRATLQFLGRTLRRAPGKKYADYVDLVDETHASTKEASMDRIQTLESEGYAPFIKYWGEYQT